MKRIFYVSIESFMKLKTQLPPHANICSMLTIDVTCDHVFVCLLNKFDLNASNGLIYLDLK